MNTRHTLLAIGSALSIFVFADASAAAVGGGKAALDKDADGRVTREEAAARPGLARHFDQFDANKDGFLTREEIVTGTHQAAVTFFKRVDTDSDGKISRDEAAKSAPRISKQFDLIDSNHDGFISAEELRAAWQHWQAKHE